ncbi:hypothetical protein [Microbacterium profundi]
MKVLIYCGAGFIGSKLVTDITNLGEGHAIVGLDDFSTVREPNLTGQLGLRR